MLYSDSISAHERIEFHSELAVAPIAIVSCVRSRPASGTTQFDQVQKVELHPIAS